MSTRPPPDLPTRPGGRAGASPAPASGAAPGGAPTNPVAPGVARELELLVRARYPLTWLVTHEERRAERMLREVAGRLQRDVVFWTSSEGFDHPAYRDVPIEPAAALERIGRTSERRMFVLKDFHAYMEDARIVRRLRDAVRDLRSSYKSLILLGPVLKIPTELEKDTTVVDLALPGPDELMALLKSMLASLPPGRVAISPAPDFFERVIKASLGLTETEAENVYAKAIVNNASLDDSDIPLVVAEKKQILRKSGLLEYHEADESLRSVGGLAGVKSWLSDRAPAFSERAREYGLPAPRGVLLLGVQGCGKSLTAKAVAAEWKLPLLRLDVGRIFSSFIGASEGNMAGAIRVAESLAPAVLWVDEIEKAFAGIKSSGSVDAGTTARVFATLLTWLQEKTAPVFVVATANQVKDLPPELLRKGRFDEIFFIDLPEAKEREEILRIHLARKRRDPVRFDLPRLVAATEGWSGAEIEQGIVAALYATFPKSRDIETADVLAAMAESVPLSATMAEEMGELRSWARGRARPAS